ncbi:hypothetical protein [Mucilaginibacter aquariorum]|uniref:Uncharacterized protein n=1 Tax=Mucilaginibacter aquariorum TaxID=2967225 RepID=A0ABT1SY62_9SPHI|nr:hypothetical protein [Mucilaginibacter aquariorum]MCQ6957202.1 hypothetical protein [Mucilaginibacter aquariorum]
MEQRMRKIIPIKASLSELPEAYERVKLTELAYLSHFVQCYKPTMQIADWHKQPFYIMADGTSKTGIAFCDLLLPPYLSDHMNLQVFTTCQFPDLQGIKELWLIFVAWDSKLPAEFLQKMVSLHGLANLFDKIFHFDFLKSIIQIIN